MSLHTPILSSFSPPSPGRLRNCSTLIGHVSPPHHHTISTATTPTHHHHHHSAHTFCQIFPLVHHLPIIYHRHVALAGILRLYESALLQMDFMQLAQFLTRLPPDLSADELFSAIEATRMTADRRRGFAHVLAEHTVTSADGAPP